MGKIKKIAIGTLVVLLLLSSIGVAFAEGSQGKKTFPQNSSSLFPCNRSESLTGPDKKTAGFKIGIPERNTGAEKHPSG